MNKVKGYKSRWKFVIALALLALATIGTWTSEIDKNAEKIDYENRRKNAVTVVATVVDSYLQFREEVKWNAGAGDDVDKEVIKHPYRIHRLSYEYNGVEYMCGYGGSWSSSTIEMPKGTEVELLIDPYDPETVFDEYYVPKKASYFGTYFFLSIFLIILSVWVFKEIKYRRKRIMESVQK